MSNRFKNHHVEFDIDKTDGRWFIDYFTYFSIFRSFFIIGVCPSLPTSHQTHSLTNSLTHNVMFSFYGQFYLIWFLSYMYAQHEKHGIAPFNWTQSFQKHILSFLGFESYLTDGTQFVRFGLFVSDLLEIDSGVPF